MAKATSTADLVLHPVRMRVIQALLGDRKLTTSAIADELHDVSKATIYRQVATLAEAGVLEVVDEKRVRGAVERTYALRTNLAQVTADELSHMGPDDHRRAFVGFIAGLLATFDTYVDRGDIDLLRDRVGYRTSAFWLTDDELDTVLAGMREALGPYADRGPGDGRVRRMLSTVVIPGGESVHSQT